MKRHEALQPFSRDHNVSLAIARALERVSDEDPVACQREADKIGAYWRDELEDHFAEEERLLTPLASTESASRLASEHREIASGIRSVAERASADDLHKLGALVEAHVRWEERNLFIEIEQSASADQLERLLKDTEALEGRRADSTWAPRRGELAARRHTE